MKYVIILLVFSVFGCLGFLNEEVEMGPNLSSSNEKFLSSGLHVSSATEIKSSNTKSLTIPERDSIYKSNHPKYISCKTTEDDADDFCFTIYLTLQGFNAMDSSDIYRCGGRGIGLGDVPCPEEDKTIHCSLFLHGSIGFYSFYNDTVTLGELDWCDNGQF